MKFGIYRDKTWWSPNVLPSSGKILSMEWILSVLVIAVLASGSSANVCDELSPEAIDAKTFKKATPRGGLAAGKYTKLPVTKYPLDTITELPPIEDCVMKCCSIPSCNVAFLFNDAICYQIECNVTNLSACDPVEREGTKFEHTYMVKVREVADHITTPAVSSSDEKKHKPSDLDDAISKLLAQTSQQLGSNGQALVGTETKDKPGESLGQNKLKTESKDKPLGHKLKTADQTPSSTGESGESKNKINSEQNSSEENLPEIPGTNLLQSGEQALKSNSDVVPNADKNLASGEENDSEVSSSKEGGVNEAVKEKMADENGKEEKTDGVGKSVGSVEKPKITEKSKPKALAVTEKPAVTTEKPVTTAEKPVKTMEKSATVEKPNGNFEKPEPTSAKVAKQSGGSSENPTESSEKITSQKAKSASEEPGAAGSEKPTASSKKQTISLKKPTASSKKHSTSSEKPTASSKKHPGHSRKPHGKVHHSGEKMTNVAEKPTVGTGKNSEESESSTAKATAEKAKTTAETKTIAEKGKPSETTAEKTKTTAENGKTTAEKTSAEKAKTTAETKTTAEKEKPSKTTAEKTKTTAENGKTTAEKTTAQNGKTTAEKTTADNGKTTAEKTTAENGKTTAEKTTAENGKSTAEKTGKTTAEKTTADNGKTTAEKTGKTTAEKTTADNGKTTAEKTTAENGKTTAEKTTAENGKSTAEKTGKTTAEKTTAENGKTTAEKTDNLIKSLKGLLNNTTLKGKGLISQKIHPPSVTTPTPLSIQSSPTKPVPNKVNLEDLIKELKDLVKSQAKAISNNQAKASSESEEKKEPVLSVDTSATTKDASKLPPRKKDISCIYGLEGDCESHEECQPRNTRSRSGLCVCVPDYKRDEKTGWCLSESKSTSPVAKISTPEKSSIMPSPEKKSGNLTAPLTTPLPTTTMATTPTSPPVMQLTVSAGKPQVIRLPVNEATLSAYVVPEAATDEEYQYKWSLIVHPEGAETGVMQGKNTNKLKLSSLIAGLYMFKVVVSAPGKYGETRLNVTVLPETRINKPPVAVIKPPFQEIQLPNSAVLDGSESTDDDKVVKYNWQEVLGPLQEQKAFNSDKPMLVLAKLAPGKYRFKLTVTDSDGATNSTFANVTALKEVDYPPQANAGSNIIISLPQNSVILYGNKSTDDHGIASYEWIKKSDDKLTADMTGVRSPNLHLSKLEVGDYTFTLKVTDTAGMTSTADVHVFVKPKKNQPPAADAGDDMVIILPVSTAVLDGSKSNDDQQIVRFQWTQISGPGGLAIQDADKAVATITNLKLGEYQFRLTVYDAEQVQATSSVKVTVKENSNLAPKADAGGDKIMYLPQRTIFVDGSKSTDDKNITIWQWVRDDTSLAAGDIVNGSDHHPILQVTNIVTGRYVFILKVTDAEGLTSIDTASIIVRQDPNIKNLVELHIKADLKSFTEANKKTWASQLALLLHKTSQAGDTQINIQHIEQRNGDLVIYFYVYIVGRTTREIWSGPEIVSILKRKLSSRADMLDYSVSLVDTVVCQNNCSGHGSCDTSTKRCLCDPFWMENFFKAHFSYEERNCDWSILYVIIVAFLIVITMGGVFWGVIFLVRRYRRMRPRKRHRYQLLEEFDDKNTMSMKPRGKMQNSSLMVSESDATSDEETLFVNSKKSNGHLRKNSNGFVKHTKKLKA